MRKPWWLCLMLILLASGCSKRPPVDQAYSNFIETARVVRADGREGVKAFNKVAAGTVVTWSGVVLEFDHEEIGTTIVIGVDKNTPLLDQAVFFIRSDLHPKVRKGDHVTLRGKLWGVTLGMGILVAEAECVE